MTPSALRQRTHVLLNHAARYRQTRQMRSLFEQGLSMEAIGQKFGLTRAAVHVRFKQAGIKATDGGRFLRVKRKRERHAAKLEALTRSKYGITRTEWKFLNALSPSPILKFNEQRYNAKARGVAWDMSFREWWDIWLDSGRWDFRGVGSGYVMCRKNDVGPYQKGNVYIATGQHNSSVRRGVRRNLPMHIFRHGEKYRVQIMLSGTRFYLGDTRSLKKARRIREEFMQKYLPSK